MKNFEQYVAKLWDKTMPYERWETWDECDGMENNSDVLRLAATIARDAFKAGAYFGAERIGATVGDLEKEMDTRYPLPKPEVKYRTSAPDSNGNRWQVRDGMTWVSHNYNPFHQHVPLTQVLEAMSRFEQYSDVALLAALAANPTED